MFGKKKEEEWEYIGTEGYFQKDNYGKAADDVSKRKIYQSTDHLTGVFKPYLMKNEQILRVFGNGVQSVGFDNSVIMKNAQKALLIAAPVCLVGFILWFFSSNWSKEFGTFLILFIFLCMPAILVLTLIIWVAISQSAIKADYAVTNKRVLAIEQNEWKSIDLKDIVDTRASKTRRAIIVTSKVGRHMDRMGIFYVSDPVFAKNMLDEAVQKCKSNLNEG